MQAPLHAHRLCQSQPMNLLDSGRGRLPRMANEVRTAVVIVFSCHKARTCLVHVKQIRAYCRHGGALWRARIDWFYSTEIHGNTWVRASPVPCPSDAPSLPFCIPETFRIHAERLDGKDELIVRVGDHAVCKSAAVTCRWGWACVERRPTNSC